MSLTKSLVTIGFLIASGLVHGADLPGPGRQAELLHLLKHDCGSCHGMNLKGGLGPALTPEALAGKRASFLSRTILEGRSGTPMPPWAGMISRQEAAWLAMRLLQGPGP